MAELEVECKFVVGKLSDVESRVVARGGVFSAPQRQADRYFRHPCRDFAKTDEALRIRSVDGETFVTYKGPRLNKVVKTRCELEFPIEGAAFSELLAFLGFEEVAEVRKIRRAAQLQVEGRVIVVCLDQVEGVGEFAELETMSGEEQQEAARQAVMAAARELGLERSELRSYLKMLLIQRGVESGGAAESP